MKIKGAKKVHYDSGPNMTPLVDVVMVILIFLMLAGSFGSAEHYLSSKVPLKPKGVGGVTTVPDTTELYIYVPDIRDNGVPMFQASVDGAVKDGKLIAFRDEDALRDYLESKKAEYLATDPKLEKVQVFLKPQPDTSWEVLSQAFDAAMRCGFTKVGFSST